MVRRGRWKLNYYTGAGFELFDLGADPDELHDLSARPESRTTLLELIPHLARGGWSPALAEALWRDYQRRGPRLPGRRLRTPNQFWGEGPPHVDAEDFYPADVDWGRVPIRP
jgi:arylsulfatase A-like enzyme